MQKKQCIIVAGPTAVGKTSAAIRLAKEYQTEIISADSRQCFKELNIGVARPTEDQLQDVVHHFIANHSITENITAASFEKEALEKLECIFQKSDYAIVCGGTGLYIKALAEGLNEIPQIPEETRQFVVDLHNIKGIEELRKTLLLADPDFGKQGDINNPNRMMRALEVIVHTRNPIAFYQTGEKTTRNFDISYQIMELPREELYGRINTRVDEMICAGLEDEVRSLIEHQDRPALQTVGYKEFFDYFNGLYSKEFAIEKIKQHTRNYAKRQMTWFSKYSS
jgi:tRNA dimethylallyltransferase